MTTDPQRTDAVRQFGAPMKGVQDAVARTGVSGEAMLAVARDLGAVRAVLDLAMRTGTIVGYSMGHSPTRDIYDEESYWNREHLHKAIVLETGQEDRDEIRARMLGAPTFERQDWPAADVELVEQIEMTRLSDPGESVNP